MNRQHVTWVLFLASCNLTRSTYVLGESPDGTASDALDASDPTDADADADADSDSDADADSDTDTVPTDPDLDDDGYPASVDCDDQDPSAHPGADEQCGGADLDCDGVPGDLDPDARDPRDWYLDADGDGFGDPDAHTTACEPPDGDHVEVADDCDDDDPTAHPGADEAFDGVDDDCDGTIDEGWSEQWFAPDRVENVWGTHCGGDTEFGGHGPDTTVVVTLTNRGDGLDLTVQADWMETEADWTCATALVQRDAGLQLDAGCTVATIEDLLGVASAISLSETLHYVDNDIQQDTLAGQGIVDTLDIQGDGVGNDIGTGSNDAHIDRLDFADVKVTLYCPR